MLYQKGNMKLGLLVVGILVIAAIIIVVTQGEKLKPSADISELDIISKDTAGLGGVNMHKFLDIPFVAKQIKEQETPENIEKFFSEMEDGELKQALKMEVEKNGAINTLKNYTETFTFAFDIPKNVKQDNFEDMFMMITRTPKGGPKLLDFSKKAIEQSAKGSDAKVTKLPGEFEAFLIENEVPPPKSKPNAKPKSVRVIAAQLTDELFLFGSEKKSNQSLELANKIGSKGTIKENQALMTSYQQMKDALFWSAYFNPGQAPAPKKIAESAPPKVEIEDVQSFIFILDYVNEQLLLNIEANFFDEAIASAVNQAYSGFAYMGAGMLGVPAQQLTVSIEGTKIKLNLTLTQEMLEQIANQAKTMANQKKGP